MNCLESMSADALHGDNAMPLFHNVAATITTLLVTVLGIRRGVQKCKMSARRHGGSKPGKARNRNIGREGAVKNIHDAYFLNASVTNRSTGELGPVFSENEFERRFHMPRAVYNRVYDGVLEVDTYFMEGKDCIGNKSATTHQKLVAALRQLSLGVGSDALSEFTRLSESTLHECRKRFVRAVCTRFQTEYLRRPTVCDVRMIMERHAKLGFPGALGSLDCSGWKLHCGTIAEQRRNIGKSGHPELRLESVVDDRLWIWHLKFGFPGAMNDINILDCSPLFTEVRSGAWPPFKPTFNVAGRAIDWFYWVVDGIYPPFRIFLKTIPSPRTNREKTFAKAQEAFRKSAERVYAVLFSRWHILANPSRIWYTDDMNYVVRACAILHNMIIEERDSDGHMGTKNIVSIDPNAELVPVRTSVVPNEPYAAADFYRDRVDSVEDRRDHDMLTNALANAIWNRYGKGDLDGYLHNQSNDEEEG